MPRFYQCSFKKKVVLSIKKYKLSTKKTADAYGIPLKTLEKWITAYNKNPYVFNVPDRIIENEYENEYD